MNLDTESCYEAVRSRDRRFDGRFYTGVVTTGIYCRPVCPAPSPKRANVRFFACAAAAEEAGFRPCRRCHPESAPGTPAWVGTSATVARALRLIADGALDGGDVEGLAARVGVGARHLRRLFREELGSSPTAVAQTQRTHFARRLLAETSLPVTEIAFSAGFNSVRRFNDVTRASFGETPSGLRRRRRDELRAAPSLDAKAPSATPTARVRTSSKTSSEASSKTPSKTPSTTSSKTSSGAPAADRMTAASTDARVDSIVLRVPYRPPFDWNALVRFLAPRAIPGVESVSPDAYRRTFGAGGAAGAIEVRPTRKGGAAGGAAGEAAAGGGTSGRAAGVGASSGPASLDVRVWRGETRALGRVAERTRRLFDCGADPLQIGAHLARDPALARLVAARPGLRVPGAWDGFELAVRAILGQQVSVKGATTLAGRLVALFGEPVDGFESLGLTHRFPSPETLAEADLASVGLPRARAEAIAALARAVVEGTLDLDASTGLDESIARLCELPGVGPWTASYVAMRALGEPDAFPAGDLGLRKALAGPDGAPATARDMERRAENWRPWRSYAALHLWESLGDTHTNPITMEETQR